VVILSPHAYLFLVIIMETKYKLKHFLDQESIDVILMEEKKKFDYMKKRLSCMQQMLNQSASEQEEGFVCDKSTAQTMMTSFFEIINKELKRKDPVYHKKFWFEIQQSKGEAEIDFDYLEKKIPWLGALNASIGIYKSNSSHPDLYSYMMPKNQSAASLENLLKSPINFALKGNAARNVTQYIVATYVLPEFIPAIKEMYTKVRKELNLPSVSE
jgi:hypothetical protein